MRVRFRGVRGSVPFSVPAATGHGCNTPCLELEDERTGAVLILDAGSGVVGVDLASLGEPRPISMLLTHYHWDHLSGLPFFAGLYQPAWPFALYTPALQAHDPGWLDALFKSAFFPVPYERLPNRPRVEVIGAGRVDVPGFDVTALPLNHPGGCLAYRIAHPDGDLVYATDHEFGNPAFDEPLAEFVAGAAAVVLDAHFTPEERPLFADWGHSDWRQCAEFAAATGVGRLWLFHHKPGRPDSELEAIAASARRIFPRTDTAREGITFNP